MSLIWPSLFRITTFALLITLAYFITLVYQVYFEQQKTKPAHLVDLPVFSEIWWVPVLSAAVLFFTRSKVPVLVRPVFNIYGKDKNDNDLFEARLAKTSVATYKIIFYTLMSLWAYCLLYDTSIWPGFMGGKGTVEESYLNFPYAPQVPGLVTYSLVSLGYYLDDLVNHNFFRPKSNDFWEMNLHHLVTIGLFGGMIPMNAVRPGAIISLLHGISDITIAASRIFSHTEFKVATRVVFIGQTLLFIFLRNFAIPAYTLSCWWLLKYPPNLSQY